MKLLVSFFLLVFLCGGLFAQEKVQAEKIKVSLSNSLLHAAIRDKDKNTTDVEIVIPTSQPSAKGWNFRAWETNHPIKEAIELLEVGISYQINCFIISFEAFQNADTNQKDLIFKITKEFNIQLIIKTTTFKLPINKSDLDDLEDFSSNKNIDVLLCIESKLSLMPDQTTEYLKKILASIKNKDKRIYCEAYSRDESFLQTLQQLNDPRIIPVLNWTKHHWSLTAPLNPLISKYEGNSIVRMDVALENLGKNEILALLQDYIGFRQTQCLEASKNIQGFIMDFSSGITSFGTLNAVNIYTMSEFLLKRDKDLDIINNNWFTSLYGHQDGLEIMNITSSSANILRKSLYVNNSSEIEFTKSLTPISLSQLLSSSSLDSWCKLKKIKAYKNSALFKEKLQAKESIDVLEKNYKSFIANKKVFDSKVSLSQIQRTKEMVDMMQDYTSLFLQAQFEPLEPKQLEILKPHQKKFPELEKAINDLKEIYINKKPEVLEGIPQENLPHYLQKEVKPEKQKE